MWKDEHSCCLEKRINRETKEEIKTLSLKEGATVYSHIPVDRLQTASLTFDPSLPAELLGGGVCGNITIFMRVLRKQS